MWAAWRKSSNHQIANNNSFWYFFFYSISCLLLPGCCLSIRTHTSMFPLHPNTTAELFIPNLPLIYATLLGQSLPFRCWYYFLLCSSPLHHIQGSGSSLHPVQPQKLRTHRTTSSLISADKYILLYSSHHANWAMLLLIIITYNFTTCGFKINEWTRKSV